jgi:hypothetical protein
LLLAAPEGIVVGLFAATGLQGYPALLSLMGLTYATGAVSAIGAGLSLPQADAAQVQADWQARMSAILSRKELHTSDADMNEILGGIARVYGFQLVSPAHSSDKIAQARIRKDGSTYRPCCVCDVRVNASSVKTTSVTFEGREEAKQFCEDRSGVTSAFERSFGGTRGTCTQRYVVGTTCGLGPDVQQIAVFPTDRGEVVPTGAAETFPVKNRR